MSRDAEPLLSLIRDGHEDAALSACAEANRRTRAELLRALDAEDERLFDDFVSRRSGVTPEPSNPGDSVVFHVVSGRLVPRRESPHEVEPPDVRLLWACRFALYEPRHARARGYLGFPRGEILDRVAERMGRVWCERIVHAYLDRYPAQSWSWIRRWIAKGLCDRPDHVGYLHAMIGNTGSLAADGGAGLLADPDLLDEVWRLFEIEGTRDNSLAACESCGDGSWSEALLALSAQGHLPRDRLIDATLSALERDFPQFRAGWFSRFHDKLAPSAEEMSRRTGRYLRLLGSRIGPTVSLALRSLRVLQRESELDADAFTVAAVAPLRTRPKGTVKTVLKMLDRCARSEPERKATVAATATVALAHEAADVQAAALDVIERHGSADDAELCAAVGKYAHAVSATLRGRLHRYTSLRPAALPVTTRSESLDSLPLDPRNALTPIASFDEVVATASRLLEVFDADQFERVLDGMVRIGPPGTASERRLAEPLVRRSRQIADADTVPTFAELRPDLARMLTAWGTRTAYQRGLPVITSPDEAVRGAFSDFVQRSVVEPAMRLPGGPGSPPVVYMRHPLCLFSDGRFAALAETCRSSAGTLLLATPTHRGGWIDPVELAARVCSPARSRDLHDHVLGLLRLAPTRRREALDRLTAVHGELAAAARHALGGEGETVGPTSALWFAAARARAPGEDDSMVALAFPSAGPDAGRAARYALPPLPAPPGRSRVEPPYPSAPWFVVREPWPPRPPPSSHFPVLAHAAPDAIGASRLGGDWLRWWAGASPGDREPLVAHALTRLLTSSSVADQLPACAEILTLAETRWSGLAPYLLAVALSAASADVRMAAVGVLESRSARTLPAADLLGGAIAWAARTGEAPWSRLAKSLAQIAPLSVRQARYAVDVVVAAVAADPRPPARGIAPLLDVVLEACTQVGARVENADARAYLRSLGGKRTGRVARALLAR